MLCGGALFIPHYQASLNSECHIPQIEMEHITMIPHDWIACTWGDLVTLEYGKPLRGYSDSHNPYPVFGANGQIGWHSDYLVNGAGVIIGRKGTYRGVCFSDKPFWVIDTAFYLKVIHDGVDVRWAYYRLLNDGIGHLNSGTAIPSTSRQDFYAMPVHLPPLETQRRIVSILSPYDDLIENNKHRIKTLEEMMHLIFREWFVNFRFPCAEGVVLVESELGMIPHGWTVGHFGDIACQTTETIRPDSISGDIPYVGLADMPSKSIALMNWRTASDAMSPKRVFRRGDILLGSIRPYLHKVAIAPLDGVASTDVMVIALKEEYYRGYALLVAPSQDFVAYANAFSCGTVIPRIHWRDIANYPVLLPPDDLLCQFNDLVTCYISLIEKLILENKTLQKPRDLLLPHLMSGRVVYD